MARRTSSRPARRAGSTPATSPHTAAATTVRPMVSVRDRGGADDRIGQRGRDGDTEQPSQRHAEDGAEDRHHGGLGEDHPAGLAADHADRPEEPDLPGALHDRQGEGVGDPQQGDEQRQPEQPVDRDQDAVELRLLVGGELAPVLELDLGVLRDDRRPWPAELGPVRSRRDAGEAVEVEGRPAGSPGRSRPCR